jgi:propanol-preferring alcohol dehydrogenase
MKGVYLPGNTEAHVKEWPDPKPTFGEVLIEVKASALCRSDMTIYYGEPLVGEAAAGKVIPGHEPSGVIKEVAKGVKYFKEDDRVAVTCFLGCGSCRHCRSGEPMLCNEVKFLGMDKNGGDAELLVAPENVCLLMPKEMSYVTGAVSTDAIGNLYATMKEMNVCGDDLIAVVGIGPMGLSGVLAAKGMGAAVAAIDLVQSRLDKAKELGADYIVNAKKTDHREFARDISKGEGVDKSVDCSGSAMGISTALDITRKHGVVAQIGETGKKKVEINPSEQLIRKKLTWYGSWYFNLSRWGEVADFIISKIGNGKAEEIVSHRYPLEEESVSEAFKLFDEHKTFKVVFTP